MPMTCWAFNGGPPAGLTVAGSCQHDCTVVHLPLSMRSAMGNVARLFSVVCSLLHVNTVYIVCCPTSASVSALTPVVTYWGTLHLHRQNQSAHCFQHENHQSYKQTDLHSCQLQAGGDGGHHASRRVHTDQTDVIRFTWQHAYASTTRRPYSKPGPVCTGNLWPFACAQKHQAQAGTLSIWQMLQRAALRELLLSAAQSWQRCQAMATTLLGSQQHNRRCLRVGNPTGSVSHCSPKHMHNRNAADDRGVI